MPGQLGVDQGWPLSSKKIGQDCVRRIHEASETPPSQEPSGCARDHRFLVGARTAKNTLDCGSGADDDEALDLVENYVARLRRHFATAGTNDRFGRCFGLLSLSSIPRLMSSVSYAARFAGSLSTAYAKPIS